MVVGMFCVSTAATTSSTTQLDVTGNEMMNSIQVTTPDDVDHVVKTSTSSIFVSGGNTYTNTVYQYDIALPYTVGTSGNVSVTLNPESPAFMAPVPPIPQFYGMLGSQYASGGQYTLNKNLSNGTASMGGYLHKHFSTVRNHCDTYTFNFFIYYPISIGTADGAFIEWTGGNGTVKGTEDPNTIPTEFTLWAEAPTITVGGVEVGYDYMVTGNPGDPVNYAYTITPSHTTSVQIQATISGVTYTITCPASSNSLPAGKSPTSVVSYLPLGQYATGNGWGNSTGKFVSKSAIDSTGVSLGTLGGYIEFYFEDGIMDDPKNPYGVDFVVYGNAFNGNPEAGAVQVSTDGAVWYELAGSKYYDGGFVYNGNQGADGKFVNGYSGTLRNTSVGYSLKDTGENQGIYAHFAGNDPLFTTVQHWWPLTGEGYPMGTPHTNSVVTVEHSNTAMTFGGITAVPDSNVTAEYAFGYADVTPNGSPSHPGDAVNPYTAYTNGKTGGDGFDLEWAVDITTGLPVSIANETFHYVRVYSNVLDNGAFGETSCEVCGIFTAYREDTENVNVGRTTAPTIKYNNKNITNSNATITYADSTVIYDIPGDLVAGKKVKVTGAGTSIVNINGANSSEFTVAENGQYVRIIVQDGTEEPYIVIIK
jgi:hypothetical protein